MSTIVTKAEEKMPADATLILLGEYGSSAHGVAVGTSDYDFIGIAVEPKRVTLGMDNYEHTVIKDAAVGVATAADEEEGTIYALRKFVKLAEAGNTAMMSALYLPKYTVLTPAGELFVQNRDLFLSRSVLKRFAGHLATERKRMKGELKEKVLRPALVEQFGFDTKAAYQAMKLGFHGRRFAKEGVLDIPFPTDEIELILRTRRGELSVEDVDLILGELLEFIDEQAETSELLPETPDHEKLNALCLELYALTYGF